MSFSSPTTSRTIAVIGGGLSGTLVAAQLLRQALAGARVLLIERHPPAGRGVAYSTESPEHVLNVVAGRLSAFPERPDHFLEWIADRCGRPGFPAQVSAGDFLARRLYGEYLSSVLAEARQGRQKGVEFESVTGEVIDLEERGEETARLTLQDGRTFEAQRVVLALGNLPGEYPIRRSLRFYHGRRYVHVPWREDALAQIGQDEDILLVGAGLTAVDMVLLLERRGHRGTIHAVSRRGLRVQVHRPVAPYPPFLEGEEWPSTVLGMMRRVRAEVRKAAAQGVDWRAVIDAIRSQTQAIWQGFSWEERARFMRHVRPYWEAHRHRVAPEVAEALAQREQAGRLRFYAGRLEELRESEAGAEVVFRHRGTEDRVHLTVAKVINCTGPRTDYSKYQHPLLINLLARGLIDHDPLALGLHARPNGQVLRYRGGPVSWLYTIGAPLKGVLWESTAVPEIRTQARELAATLLE